MNMEKLGKVENVPGNSQWRGDAHWMPDLELRLKAERIQD